MMKQFFTLIAMLLVASLTTTSHAQSIIGSWKSNMESVEGSDYVGEAKSDFIYTFNDDNTGVCNYNIYATQPLDDTSSMNFHVITKMTFEWELSGDELTVIPQSVDTMLGDVSIEPSNPEHETIIPLIRQMLQDSFDKNKYLMGDHINKNTSTQTAFFPTPNKMVLVDINSVTTTLSRM